MKKLILFLSFSIVAISSTNAQCVPDPTYTTPGIYPDSATGFSSACVGVQYDQLITNVVPVDTAVEIIPGFPVTLDFDSIVIVNFTGLPASMTYDCSTTLGGCSFAGGESGCVIISGIPTAGEVGTHDLVITVDVYVGGLSTPQATEVIDWYFIDVEDVPTISTDGFILISNYANNNQWYLDGSLIMGETGQNHMPLANGTYTVEGNCGMSDDFVLDDLGISEPLTSNFRLFPNPSRDVITIQSANTTAVESILVRSLSGNLVRSIQSAASVQTIDVNNLENGVYFVYVTSDAGTETIRFVKK